jgi:hypothetical protein
MRLGWSGMTLAIDGGADVPLRHLIVRQENKVLALALPRADNCSLNATSRAARSTCTCKIGSLASLPSRWLNVAANSTTRRPSRLRRSYAWRGSFLGRLRRGRASVTASTCVILDAPEHPR